MSRLRKNRTHRKKTCKYGKKYKKTCRKTCRKSRHYKRRMHGG